MNVVVLGVRITGKSMSLNSVSERRGGTRLPALEYDDGLTFKPLQRVVDAQLLPGEQHVHLVNQGTQEISDEYIPLLVLQRKVESRSVLFTEQ